MIKMWYFIGLILLICLSAWFFLSRTRTPSPQMLSFPTSKPFHESYLRVSSLHELWYAEYGNPKGVPVIVLHGGPGAGCNDDDMKFFDPNFWRIILLDQRGAKRSKPFGEMKDNNTQNLIADLETLREQLKIEKWLVFGGSWGSSLALAYGEAHPTHVLGFILRGIFLARSAENQHLWYGMRDTFPDAWQEFNDFLPQTEQSDLINNYYQRVMSPDLQIATPAARAFIRYDLICSFLTLSNEKLNQFLADDQLILGVSRAFIYYAVNHFFLTENQLVENLNKINHLPLIIVHGRYDTITLAKSAYELHTLWPGSQLNFVDASGHSAMEPAITQALIEATETMKQQIKT